jgi:hypothetical protein
MTVRRIFNGVYSRLCGRLLVEITEEIIERFVDLYIHIHVNLNRIDGVMSFDAEAAPKRKGERGEEDEALHEWERLRRWTIRFNE